MHGKPSANIAAMPIRAAVAILTWLKGKPVEVPSRPKWLPARRRSVNNGASIPPEVPLPSEMDQDKYLNIPSVAIHRQWAPIPFNSHSNIIITNSHSYAVQNTRPRRCAIAPNSRPPHPMDRQALIEQILYPIHRLRHHTKRSTPTTAARTTYIAKAPLSSGTGIEDIGKTGLRYQTTKKCIPAPVTQARPHRDHRPRREFE